jgi:hypothetical protein
MYLRYKTMKIVQTILSLRDGACEPQERPVQRTFIHFLYAMLRDDNRKSYFSGSATNQCNLHVSFHNLNPSVLLDFCRRPLDSWTRSPDRGRRVRRGRVHIHKPIECVQENINRQKILVYVYKNRKFC